jgi:hypothetical protein
MLQQAIKFVNRQPWLRRLALAVLSLLPGVKSRIEALALGHAPAPVFAKELGDLTPEGQQIYHDLLKAIEQHQSRMQVGKP